MLSIFGTPKKIEVVGKNLDDVIADRQQAQAVAAAAPAVKEDGWEDRVKKADDQA